MRPLEDVVREILASQEGLSWLWATGAMHGQMSAAEVRRGFSPRPGTRDQIHGVILTTEQTEAYRSGFASGSCS